METDGLMDRLIERADELGIPAGTDEERIEALLAREVVVPAPSEAECRRAYDQDRACCGSGALAEVDHLLFAVTGATPIDRLRAKAEAVLLELRREPGLFARRARELSNCPSGALGGRLGQLSAGACVPEFWAAIAAHGRAGLLPTLVRTRFGLHIVRVARFIPGEILPFEQVRAAIASTLTRRATVAALRVYADELAHATTARP